MNAEMLVEQPTQADSPARRIGAFLRSRGIAGPVRPFVSLVSNVYHRIEAPSYDQIHSEIFETAGHWRACLRAIEPGLPGRVRVLEIGAGTGFASEQVVGALGGRVSRLVCQDLSRDILLKCRERIAPLTDRANYVAGELGGLAGEFDLVVTNAVLHHVLDLPEFFGAVRRLLRPGGTYIAGHEPSDAFYADRALYRWTERYRTWRRLRKLASPEFYRRRLGSAPEPRDPYDLANEELVRIGAIPGPLPPGAVQQLVDIHVPPADPDGLFFGQRGFNAKGLREQFLPDFDPAYLLTYPHIKEARCRMGPIWRAIDTRLARRHPDSGANFLMALRRR